MARHFPTLEVSLDAARAVWPHRAASYAGTGWKLAETLVDFDRIKHIETAAQARSVYAAHAARLNEEYGKGHTLFRASSLYQ